MAQRELSEIQFYGKISVGSQKKILEQKKKFLEKKIFRKKTWGHLRSYEINFRQSKKNFKLYLKLKLFARYFQKITFKVSKIVLDQNSKGRSN